jgi:hypothetical protein
MRFLAKTFWLAKDAEAPEQFEDSFELDAERGIAAIADGVSSTIFSGLWARILTQAAVADPPCLHDPAALQDWLQRRRAEWSNQIDTSRLTWFQRPKMIEGAMSTWLWCELTPPPHGDGGDPDGYRLSSFAIGDCCLFHLRQGELLYAFPLTSETEFGIDPAVIGSIDRKQDHLLEFRLTEAECRPGDLLVLCTDAVGLWATKRYAAGQSVCWEDYWEMPDQGWQSEIAALRREKLMRYDDSTLVLLRVLKQQAEAAAIVGEAAGPEIAAEMPIAVGEPCSAGEEFPLSAIPGEQTECRPEDPESAPPERETPEERAAPVPDENGND